MKVIGIIVVGTLGTVSKDLEKILGELKNGEKIKTNRDYSTVKIR